MASGKSDFAENKVLDYIFGRKNWDGTANTTVPATWYVSLQTDTNTATQRDAGTVTEVSTGTWTNYARVAVTNDTTQWPAASGGSKSNANAISFGTVTAGANVSATSFGIWDASTAGNLVAWGDLTGGPITIANGNTVSFAANALTVTED